MILLQANYARARKLPPARGRVASSRGKQSSRALAKFSPVYYPYEKSGTVGSLVRLIPGLKQLKTCLCFYCDRVLALCLGTDTVQFSGQR